MSTRHAFALIVIFCTAGQLGCCAMMRNGCGGGCGMGGQAYNDSCPSCGVADASCGCPSCGVADSCCDDPSCGLADASCGCPDASCGCPDASCGCPNDCGGGVGCGTPVKRCRLLARIRNALNGCSSGCYGPAYYSEWQDSPPSRCETCDQFGNYTGGNYTGGPYASPHGRRAQMAKRNFNFEDELRSGKESSETIYR